MPEPKRGEIWLTQLSPTRRHEQSGTRPVLIFSDDSFNESAAELVIIVPATTTRRGLPYHVEVNAPEGGLRRTSFLKCEDIRSVSMQRLVERWGEVSGTTLDSVAYGVRRLLRL